MICLLYISITHIVLGFFSRSFEHYLKYQHFSHLKQRDPVYFDDNQDNVIDL